MNHARPLYLKWQPELMTKSLASLIALFAALTNFSSAGDSISPEQLDFFETQVRPNLIKYCYECHSVEAGESRGGLYLDTREAMREGGSTGPIFDEENWEYSLFLDAITWADPNYEMPPKQKMPEEVIASLTKWVEMGAPDPRIREVAMVETEIFELNALDYLLKPVSPDRLALTIDRIRSTLASQEAPPEEARLREWLSEEMAPIPSNWPARIEIRDRGNTSFVPVREIQYFQADGNYIEVHAGERAPLIRMTMAKLETQLNPDQFVRVSRSAIVAVTRVTSIEKKGRHEFWVHLDTGDRIAASRNPESLEQAIMKL